MSNKIISAQVLTIQNRMGQLMKEVKSPDPNRTMLLAMPLEMNRHWQIDLGLECLVNRSEI